MNKEKAKDLVRNVKVNGSLSCRRWYLFKNLRKARRLIAKLQTCISGYVCFFRKLLALWRGHPETQGRPGELVDIQAQPLQSARTVQHFDMKQPAQTNRVLLTELQDKCSIHKVEVVAANWKNKETLPCGTYIELINQRSFGISTSKGC